MAAKTVVVHNTLTGKSGKYSPNAAKLMLQHNNAKDGGIYSDTPKAAKKPKAKPAKAAKKSSAKVADVPKAGRTVSPTEKG